MACNFRLSCIFLAILIFHILQEANAIGINYGLLGNDLPDPKATVALLQSRRITKIRIFTPDHRVLEALRGSGIEVWIGTLNEDLPALATNPGFAANWVRTNVAPYAPNVKISGVTAGNEIDSGPLSGYLLGALKNLNDALIAVGIRVPVTTTVSYGVMGQSYPPSSGSFNPSAAAVIGPVAGFLSSKGYPLLANVYPYFAYVSDPFNINVGYALLRNDGSTVVMDGGLRYTNILDAMVDAMYSALERVGAHNVNVIVSETGWPSQMGPYATVDSAGEYNNNLVRRVTSGNGTPKRPLTRLEAYIFAMYNENMKPEGIERNWGLYYPNRQEVYHVNF